MFDLIDTAITGDQFLLALHDTLIMVAVSLGFGALIGVPLGIVLVVCRPGGIVANPVVHQALNPLINVLRSLPFIILLIVILPFTRLLVGTTIGTAGAIVPLIVFVAPYIARLVESSLLEVDEGILEAADAMGATPLQTVWHFMLPEAAASLILALTTATIGLLGATAMAGTVGRRRNWRPGDHLMAISASTPLPPSPPALVLIVIVQLIQTLGTRLARRLRRD
ncbi:methionine ABC transporter permease [Klebsiella pneumoniae]|uniref:Methionine ABC transporter permease n=1 Tax=Klebsiella pneumoniae TaxID=573 RepID=A0A2X3F6I7_KLEPN|nr:methionine ABC transporter permease [Klebsiella pneumoniae]